MIRRGRWLVAVVVVLIPLGAAAQATAGTTSKPYSLVVNAGSPSYETGTGPAQNPSFGNVPLTAAGETVGITATFTNETGTQQLGSANLVAPSSSFSVVGITSVSSGSATLAKNCSVNGATFANCVALRNLSLPPGQSVTVAMSVTTPGCLAGNSFAWVAEVKQANSFSGPPGNDLFLDTGNSQPDTVLDGACSLKFGTQPTDALVGAFITGTAFNPFGPPVTVTVVDSSGAAVAGSTAPVTVALGGNNPGNLTLGGTTTEPASNATPSTGVASFADLTVGASGNLFKLAASSGSLTGDTSGPFNIQNQQSNCASGTPCGTIHDHTVNKDGSITNTVTIATGSGASQGIATESVNANNGAPLTCPGYTTSDPNTYEEFAPQDRTKTVTTTFRPIKKLGGSTSQILKAQQICFGAPYSFTTASGAPAQGPQTLPDGSTGFIGLLQNCTGSTVGPCHDRQSDTTTPDSGSPNGFDIVLSFDVPAGLAGDPMHT